MSATQDPPAGVPEVMRRLLADDPGRPRVTWYGPNGERVELSAKTLDNWVSKTSNLLVDELDVGPGSRLGVALPAHWRTLVWLLAGWTVGAHLIVFDQEATDRNGAARNGPGIAPSPIEKLTALVTDRPSAPPPGTRESVLVVVPLPALATRFAGDVPSGALDAAAEVRLQPDVFPGSRGPAPFDPALTITGPGTPTVDYGELIGRALAAVPPDGTRSPLRLLTGAGPGRALADYLGPLVVGGSVVIHHDLAALDGAARAHLAEQEGVTAVDG
jgi:uncharacterized protein (TIGR03089 family)